MSQNHTQDKTVTIKINSDILRRIDEDAKTAAISRSEHIRKLICLNVGKIVMPPKIDPIAANQWRELSALLSVLREIAKKDAIDADALVAISTASSSVREIRNLLTGI